MVSSETETEEGWEPNREHSSAVDNAVSQWRQGDVAELPLSVWVADKGMSLTPEAASAAAAGPVITVRQAPASRRVALVSQSCDIVKPSWRPSKASWPFVQVCPVVDLKDDVLLDEASGGHSTRFAPLPGIGPTMFADLNVCTTLEKAMLIGVAHHQGCLDDDQRTTFASVVARNRGRFAFPDGTDAVLNPLRDWFRGKRKKETPEGRAIARVHEIRVRRADSTPWDADVVQIELIFVIEPVEIPRFDKEAKVVPKDETIEWLKKARRPGEIAERLESEDEPFDRYFLWQQLVAAWIKRCGQDPRVLLLGASAESGLEYSVSRAWHEPRLEFDHLSSSY